MPNRHPWQGAAAFAARAHRHQVRKDKQTPYFSHPVRVALTITTIFDIHDEEILAAALLHDTIEDTSVDYDDIHKIFGKNVADYVAALTKDMRLIEPKREISYDRQLANGPWQSRLIKLADVYDNLLDPAKTASVDKMLKKARRAIKLAERDKRLAKPRAIVARLVKSISAARR
jgi:(p)ppGpp synthase/HD superfamily hydrolase